MNTQAPTQPHDRADMRAEPCAAVMAAAQAATSLRAAYARGGAKLRVGPKRTGARLFTARSKMRIKSRNTLHDSIFSPSLSLLSRGRVGCYMLLVARLVTVRGAAPGIVSRVAACRVIR